MMSKLRIEELVSEEMPKRGVKPLCQRESVAFLLGAGFSIPMGYPTGAVVNKGILQPIRVYQW